MWLHIRHRTRFKTSSAIGCQDRQCVQNHAITNSPVNGKSLLLAPTYMRYVPLLNTQLWDWTSQTDKSRLDRSNFTSFWVLTGMLVLLNPRSCLIGVSLPGIPTYSCTTSVSCTEPTFDTMAVTRATTSQREGFPPWAVGSAGGRYAALTCGRRAMDNSE